MNALFLLVPLALALVGLAIAAFRWATRHDQFDDLDTPAYRILFDAPDGTDDALPPGVGSPHENGEDGHERR